MGYYIFELKVYEYKELFKKLIMRKVIICNNIIYEKKSKESEIYIS